MKQGHHLSFFRKKAFEINFVFCQYNLKGLLNCLFLKFAGLFIITTILLFTFLNPHFEF